MTEEKKYPPTLTEDSADMVAALINMWVALEAIKETLTEPQAGRVSVALRSVSKVMSSMLTRHNIVVPITPTTKEAHHE